jgi:hypothetical protein
MMMMMMMIQPNNSRCNFIVALFPAVFPVFTLNMQCLLHVTVNLTRDLRSSGLVPSVEWYYLTGVSGQPIGPIFKGQETQAERLVDS